MYAMERLLSFLERDVSSMEKRVNEAEAMKPELEKSTNRFATGHNLAIADTLGMYTTMIKGTIEFGRELDAIYTDKPDLMEEINIKPVKYSAEKRRERSKDIVWFYLSNQFDNKGIIPGARDVADLLEIDQDLVEEVIEGFKGIHDVSEAI